MTDWTQLTLRLLHLMGGVFWAGTGFYLTLFLGPALKGSGPAGDVVVRELILKRKLGVFMPLTALVTVLSGFAMYWRNISASSGVWAHSRPGMVYGIGAATAVVALVLGGARIGPGFQKIAELQMASDASGAPMTQATADEILRTRKRVGAASDIASVALFITVITMAIGRYM